jgi:ribonuclease Y
MIWYIIVAVAALAVGGLATYLFLKTGGKAKLASAQAEAKQILEDAIRTAETRKKESLLEAKEETIRLKNDADNEIKERRREISRQEHRLAQKEENLDGKLERMEKKEVALQQKYKEAEDKIAEISALKETETVKLEKISGMTSDEAKRELLDKLSGELQHETALKLSEYEAQFREEADAKAKDILSLAIQRCAADHVSEVAISVVSLPNEDMKGRIIGREGRNIRTIETLTGVELIIDDTPEVITISGFDPVRREIARLALEKLIADGRIHPARIEEMVEKAQRDVEQSIKQAGEKAVFETGVHGLNPELVKLLGRRKYRTSYGQNVLRHSIEVSLLAGIMADELGVDSTLAKRAGLLHDIGKALTAEIEGSHVAIGVDVCRKYKEPNEVIHAVEAHHNDVEPRTAIACIVQAADAISAARPGARSENLESYIKRLQKLEEICMSYEGVEKCYAMQAGREVRIMVKPEVIDDERMILVAREIAQQIENDMEYPGQIKVNLIRESRAVDVAK